MSLLSAAVMAELASTGTLRAVINLGNAVLAGKHPIGGLAQGVTVDLTQALAQRLGLPFSLLLVENAAKSVEALATGAADVGYLATDPARAAQLIFSPAYLLIEGVYLVSNTSAFRNHCEIDKPGIRIAAAQGSAYDLFLKRTLKHASLVYAATSQAVVDTFVAQKLDVAAGVRQQLEADASRVGNVRVLPERFMVIEQAMAVPIGRLAAAAWVSQFIETMKANGFVAQSLARHRIDGAQLAPVARPFA
jgi:polar amino acid transport system substrate-binding protein